MGKQKLLPLIQIFSLVLKSGIKTNEPNPIFHFKYILAKAESLRYWYDTQIVRKLEDYQINYFRLLMAMIQQRWYQLPRSNSKQSQQMKPIWFQVTIKFNWITKLWKKVVVLYFLKQQIENATKSFIKDKFRNVFYNVWTCLAERKNLRKTPDINKITSSRRD